jgi:hypothetical protein
MENIFIKGEIDALSLWEGRWSDNIEAIEVMSK